MVGGKEILNKYFMCQVVGMYCEVKQGKRTEGDEVSSTILESVILKAPLIRSYFGRNLNKVRN